MNHNKLLPIISIALLGIILFSSCSKNQDDYYKVRFATVIPAEGEIEVTKSTYRFLSDDSLIFVPTNYSEFPSYEPENNDRVILYYLEAEDGTKTYYPTSTNIVIKGITGILTKDIVYTSEIDTLGDAIALPQQVWYSGGYEGAGRFVNIEFVFYSSSLSTTKHIINVAQDVNGESVEDGYYVLEFKHNDNNLAYFDMRSYGYIAVPLDERATAEGIKGLAIKFKIDDETEKIIKVDY